MNKIFKKTSFIGIALNVLVLRMQPLVVRSLHFKAGPEVLHMLMSQNINLHVQ